LILQSRRGNLMRVMAPELQADLYEIARRWRNGGLEITVRHTTELQEPAQRSAAYEPQLDVRRAINYDTTAHPLTFGRLSRFRLGTAGVLSALVAMAARRSSGGGFGRIIPDPSTTGGG